MLRFRVAGDGRAFAGDREDISLVGSTDRTAQRASSIFPPGDDVMGEKRGQSASARITLRFLVRFAPLSDG